MKVAHVVNGVSETIVGVAVGAVVGGVAAAAVPALGVPVLTGALFCGTTVLVGKIVDATLGKLFNLEGTSGITHAFGRVVTVLVAAGVAVGVATLLGFPISLVAGLAVLGVILLAELIATFICRIVAGIGNLIIDEHNRRTEHTHSHI